MLHRLLHTRTTAFLLASLLSTASRGQVHYTLTYADSNSSSIRVTIDMVKPPTATVVLIMPRSIPGDYAVTKYDLFIKDPQAVDAQGNSRPLLKDDLGAPRWTTNDSGFHATRVVYDVDCKQMDNDLHAASDKSIIRPGFAGLLNYSVFGWIEGYDRQPVSCRIQTVRSWPVFSTLAPSASPPKGRLDIEARDYYELADAQTFLGPRFRVREYQALVPVFIADYSEGSQPDMDNLGWMESKSLDILKDYFGEIPFPYYCALFREAARMPGDDPGNFAQEHLQSSTFFGDTSRIMPVRLADTILWLRLASYLHHMAHAYIPLRCYGDTYRPYVMEVPPIINNIWFNEGFMWYIVADTLKQKRLMDEFRQIAFGGPPQIRQLSLQQLSQIASTEYADDFRLGSAVFARGALMAAEINAYVKAQTNGRASMRTIYRYLYEWSRRNGRPFALEEFPGLLQSATGVDVSGIYDKWQRPVMDPGPVR